MTDNTLVTIEQERSTAAQLYGDDNDIAKFGYAVQKVAPWAEKMKPNDIGLVVRRALAMGVDPLNPHEVQIWTDNKGRVQFQLAYTLMAEWVRHFHGLHTEPQYRELDEAEKDQEGLTHSTMAWRVTFIMRDDLDTLNTLVNVAGFAPEDARAMVTVTGLGVAYPGELSSQYFAPAGRSPAWRVQKRALVDAYRRKFGTPTRDQIVELRRATGRDRIEPNDWVVAVENGGYDDQAQLAAENEAMGRKVKAEVSEMTPVRARALTEKNRTILHAADDDAETRKPAQKASGNGQPASRPVAPERLREMLRKKAADRGTSGTMPATEKQAPFVASKFAEALADQSSPNEAYHLALGWLWDVTSAKDLTLAQAKATLDWLLEGRGPDKTGDTPLHEHAPEEARRVLREALKAQGQQELFDE